MFFEVYHLRALTSGWACCEEAWKCEILLDFSLNHVSSLNKPAFLRGPTSWPDFLKFKSELLQLDTAAPSFSLQWALPCQRINPVFYTAAKAV